MARRFIFFAVFCCLIGISLCAGIANAAPSVKISDKKDNVTIQEAVTNEILEEIKKGVDETKDLVFKLEKIDSNEDLAKLCEAFPNMKQLNIDRAKGMTSIAPVAKLKDLTRFRLSGVAAPVDLTPLSALSGLKVIDLMGSNVADLAPLSGLPELTTLNLNEATVKDFSPLAGCPALKELNVYASKGADYSTLGKLAQVQTLFGGLTKINDISWITGMTKLKKYQMNAEEVTDYTPLAKLQLEDLAIVDMRAPVDLKQLSGVVSLKKLKLHGVKIAGGFEGLASLVNLEELTLMGMNANRGTAVDLAFIKSMPNLKKLDMNDSEIRNFDAVSGCAKLASVIITSKTTGIDNLEALKKLPNLTELVVAKGAFPDNQLKGFANPKIKISQR